MAFNESDILRYLNNELSAKQRAKLESALENDAELKKVLLAIQASELPYAAAFSQLNDTKAPASLFDFIERQGQSCVMDSKDEECKNDHKNIYSLRSKQKHKLLKIACFALLAFSAGFATHVMIDRSQEYELISMQGHSPEIFESIAIYQSLYARNTVENVNQPLVHAQELLASFNQSNQSAIALPNLTDYGYEFRRVQQLTFNGRPLLQFVYLGADGEPVAVCVVPAISDHHQLAEFSSFSTEYAGMNVVQGNGKKNAYIIVSKEPKEVLEEMPKHLTMSL